VLRFKLDENVPISLESILKKAGHAALTVGQQGLVGCHDAQLASACTSENRVLMTLDTGFGDIRVFLPARSAGIIILRPARQDRDSLHALVRRLTHKLPSEGIDGQLWIVESASVRIRC
jgi:predicted nuclease of predicted toxin-antitoxin system